MGGVLTRGSGSDRVPLGNDKRICLLLYTEGTRGLKLNTRTGYRVRVRVRVRVGLGLGLRLG